MYLPPSTAGEEILHWNFSPLHRTLLYHPAGRKFAWNRSICYAFRDIDTFPLSAKIQDGRRKWRKMKFFPFGQDTLVSPCGSKIRSKFLDLLRFSRYWHFFIFRKNLRWPPKVAKIEIFPLCPHILTKCSKYNTFQVIIDLVHDFINFNALKIILIIHKKNFSMWNISKMKVNELFEKYWLSAILLVIIGNYSFWVGE